MIDVVRHRLAVQDLSKPAVRTPAELVARLGAVQAQDYAGAKWALGQRIVGATDASVEAAIDSGAIVRTHVLRPTWHFVAAADLRWMLELTAPRVLAAMAYYHSQLEITDAIVRRGNAAIAKALQGGKHLTRAELASVLQRARINTVGDQRMGHFMMRAELAALVCSGARRGKQATYALVDERVPPTPALARDEALAALAERYFSTRGPATAQDFAWWSGLTVADARRAVSAIAPRLEQETHDGRTFWWSPDRLRVVRRGPQAHLLPNYDEYFIGYKDRSAIAGRVKDRSAAQTTSALSGHVLTIDGQIVGGWKRTLAAKRVAVHVTLLTKLNTQERLAAEQAKERYAEFLRLNLH